jgi:hypothetical protein
MHQVGVVYLYRFAEGEGPVRRFLETYRNHPAGADHDLHVVLKGFPDSDSAARGRALFENIPFDSVEHADIEYDVGSYRYAATVVPNRRLLFLNTFSQILADHWLAHFDRALDLPGIGIAGATGSWLANTAPYEAAIKFVLDKMRGSKAQWQLDAPGEERQHIAYPAQHGSEGLLRQYLSAPADYLRKFYAYGRYPNPHIRTNAFMMERDRFLSLQFPRLATKSDAHKFESGRRSMTKQLLRQKLAAVVVDKNGKVYGVSEWKSSATFWSDEQANLIIADNRTSEYAAADRSLRQRLEKRAWVRPWDWSSTRTDPSAIA